MNLIGANVKHKLFGIGQVIEKTEEYIVVDFCGQEKQFIYPDVFKDFLEVEDENIKDTIQEDILKKEKGIQLYNARRNEQLHNERGDKWPSKHSQAINKIKIPPKKLNERANIAFKCNYCDGGCSKKHIGYRAACSDATIEYNITKENRVWCSSEESQCRQYFDGEISREELDSWCQNDEFVCYESQILIQWKAMAGVVQRGVNKGRPIKLHQVQTNSLCVLTTRKPHMKEKDRFIFGVFLVDETYEGDNRDEGYVTTNSKYKMELTPDEAIHMRFWNYHANGNQSEKALWGSGLYRYLEDEVAVQILRDIVEVKQGRKEKQLAQEFLEYFCKVNGVKLSAVAEPNGALIRAHKCRQKPKKLIGNIKKYKRDK